MLSISNYIKNPSLLLDSLVRNLGQWLPDRVYLKLRYRFKTGRYLNLDAPKGFNEKIQWLKLYDRNPAYTKMVDKYLVKDYVAEILGEQYIIPTIGIWNDVQSIDFNNLPNQFVLKTTNGGGGNGVVICKDKDRLDFYQAKNKLKKSLNQDIYNLLREWPYKNVEKRIIAEKYMEDENGSLNDYKVLCFGGVAKLIEYHTNRFNERHAQDFYDRNWKKTGISQNSNYTATDEIAPCPSCLSDMIDFSETLSRGIPLCRIDWYVVGNRLYFGEITFYDGSGFELFDDDYYEELLGSWIPLPIEK